MTDEKYIRPNGFVKHDLEKIDLTMFPWESLEEIAKVLMNGAKKYGRDNWKKCDDRNTYVKALLRHQFSYFKGEKKDPDTKLQHLAHAACNLLFLIYWDLEEENGLQ